MHHDKALYGEDAKTFRPERWFEKDPEKLAAMIRTNGLIFGYGNWQCLGKPIAYIEINKIIFEVNIIPRIQTQYARYEILLMCSQLLKSFDLALINPTQ
jgi:hypothetical protein